MTTEERMADLQLEAVAAGRGKGREEEEGPYYQQQSRRGRQERSWEERVFTPEAYAINIFDLRPPPVPVPLRTEDLQSEDPGEVACYSEQSGMEERARSPYYKEVMEIYMRDLDTSLYQIDALQPASPVPSSSPEEAHYATSSGLNDFHKQIDIRDDGHDHLGTSVEPISKHQMPAHLSSDQEADSIVTEEGDYVYSFESSQCSGGEMDPIVSIPTSEEEDVDSDNIESQVEKVIENVPGNERHDIVKRIRSIRLKYRVPWAYAAGILFFRLIKSALKVRYSSESEFNEYIEDMFTEWKDTLKFFMPTKYIEKDALNWLEKACLKARTSFPVYPKILSCLHKHNIISDRTIVYWANSIGWKYVSNETFLKESSKLIESIKRQGSYNDDPIPLYGSEDKYEGERFDDDCTSEDGMDN